MPFSRIAVGLQKLKGRGLVVWRFGFEAESGLGEESADGRGPVLDAAQAGPDGGGEFVQDCRGRPGSQAGGLLSPGGSSTEGIPPTETRFVQETRRTPGGRGTGGPVIPGFWVHS